ncbi:unnamed protein product [Phaedon cochleariae]|uniref:RRM domain-containing protein n=1 Tax=Phaedon cochleariae TaxID=80249 RepID=A0A9P0DV38_PHACE|nr:unnamed protein product [Phaedon cochleariae]
MPMTSAMDDKERSRDRDRDRPRRSGGGDRSSRNNDSIRDRSNDRGREVRSMKSSQNRVYVSNIPYEYRWQDIKDLFRDQVGDVQFVELFIDDNDKPKGSGIVEFSDSASVDKALDIMQRYEVKGRKLVVKDDAGITRDKHGAVVGGSGGRRNRDSDRFRDDHRNNSGGGSSMSLRSDDKWGNTYGLSPHFLESLNIDGPLCNRVFVANLEYNVDKKKLKEVFRLAGRVIRVDLPIDKDGKSRGFAIVEYDHPVEAVQAISMLGNRQLHDRTLAVRMDRVNDAMKLPDGLKSVGMGLGPNGEPLKNVAHNLPSLSSNTQSSGAGAGLLGAVPNSSLQLASALQGLGNVGGLGGLANQQVLQAANLSGLASNLLGNGLTTSDLSSLVQNAAAAAAAGPLAAVQNTAAQQQLAAFAAQNNSAAGVGAGSGLGGGNVGGMHAFGRGGGGGGDGMYGHSVQSSNTNSRAFQNSSGLGGGGGGGGLGSGYGNSDRNDRMSFTENSSMRQSNADRQDNKGYSRKVLVSSLPASASYKMLHEKFTEFGDVLTFEEKGTGNILITYGSDWQAERAIKNLDKARIDGRMIDARLYL